MTSQCQANMQAAMMPGGTKNYGILCPCLCQLNHSTFYGMSTTPNCATGSNADMTIEEDWLYCSYGSCACASSPRNSNQYPGQTSCSCSDSTKQGSHSGGSCRPPLDCQSDNNCVGMYFLLAAAYLIVPPCFMN